MTNLTDHRSHPTWQHTPGCFKCKHPNSLGIQIIHLKRTKLSKEGVSMRNTMTTTNYSNQTFLKGQQPIAQPKIMIPLKISPVYQTILKMGEDHYRRVENLPSRLEIQFRGLFLSPFRLTVARTFAPGHALSVIFVPSWHFFPHTCLPIITVVFSRVSATL